MKTFAAQQNDSLSKVKRVDIQALRGISVLSVIIFHASNRALPNGYLGVDVFFVISGYVVTPLLLRIFVVDDLEFKFQFSNFELKQFFKRRFLRLSPALGCTLVVTAVLAIIYLPPKDLGRFAGQGLATLALIGNLGAYNYVGDYFFPNPNPLVHTWSLSTEEQLYLLIPLFLYSSFWLLGSEVNPRKILGKLYLFLGLFSFVQFFFVGLLSRYTENMPTNVTNFNFYSLTGRIWEFVIGGAAFFYLSKANKNKYRDSPILKLLSLLFVSSVLSWRTTFATPYGELLACVSAFCFIVITGPIFRKPLSVLAWFGDRSYSLYLIHMPLIYLAFYSPRWSDGFHRRTGKFIAVILTFFLGFLIYELIEKRFRVTDRRLQISFASIKKTFVLFTLVPFLFMTTLFIGSNGNFFGFDKNLKGPIDPGSLDPACYSQLGTYPCIYGDTSLNGKVALLIGDSHARHLTVGFIEAAKSADFTPVIWTQSGCQFILRETAKKNGWKKLQEAWGHRQQAENQSCFDHNQQIIDWVHTHPYVEVFVTQRSTSYVVKDFGVDSKIYLESLVGDIFKLKLRDNFVTAIGPNPEFPDLTKFFSANTLLWQKSYEATAPKRMQISKMIPNPFDDDHFMRIKIAELNMQYISTINIFCNTENGCTRNKNGEWLYSNSDHLSIAGSKLITPAITKVLQRWESSS